MILDIPKNIYEFVKVFFTQDLFDAKWQMVIFIICVVVKLIIEGVFCFMFAKFLFGNKDMQERKKVVLGFKVYFGHMFFEGFKMSFFLNYYTRMLEGKTKKEMP